VAPITAADLSGLPPALIIVAGFDILRDEGIAYADALGRAGNAVQLMRHTGFEHGFIHLSGVSRSARRAVIALAQAWHGLMAQRTSADV
jgi:acetyl esterase